MLLVAAVAGCANGFETPVPTPTRTCRQPGLWQQLGGRNSPVEFTATAGTYSFTATCYQHSGFDPIKTKVSQVNLGRADQPPRRATTGEPHLTNTQFSFYVYEGHHDLAVVDLPAGRYWFIAEGLGIGWIRTCEGSAVADISPTPRPYWMEDAPTPRASESAAPGLLPVSPPTSAPTTQPTTRAT